MTQLILIVDDEKRFRQLYADTLSEAGYTVETAASAEKALDIVRKKKPDMVVSDERYDCVGSSIPPVGSCLS
jgi:two-component system nitrogen regulation response regulator NtrX